MKIKTVGQKFIIAFLIFGLAGPLVGAIIFMPPVIIFLLLPKFTALALNFIYRIGVIPALLTALIFISLNTALQWRPWSVLTAPLVGGGVTFALLYMMEHATKAPLHPAPMPAAAQNMHAGARLIFAGSADALICGFISQLCWTLGKPSSKEAIV